MLYAALAGGYELRVTGDQILKGQVPLVGIDGFPQTLVALLALGEVRQDLGSAQVGQRLVGVAEGEHVKGAQGLGVVLGCGAY